MRSGRQVSKLAKRYIEFAKLERPEQQVTDRWEVLSLSSGALLGVVRWYGPWRQYCFWPEAHTIYNYTCMTEVSAFCANETGTRRTHLRAKAAVRAAARFGVMAEF